MIDKENGGEDNFIESELVILSKGVIDRFLKEDNPSDLIGLYSFYYYTAKWQKTNQPKANDKYVRSALGWGQTKLSNTKKRLLELGVISLIQGRNNKGFIKEWYVKMNYIWKQTTIETKNTQKQQVDTTTSGQRVINALSPSNINALSPNIQGASKEASPKEETLALAGSSKLARLINYYGQKFRKRYGTGYTANYQKVGGILKSTMANYTEYQIAFLIDLHFQWQGATGNSPFIKRRLEENCYPLEWLPQNINAMIPFAKNKLGVDINNKVEIKRLVDKNLKT
jgi:hypothetical protein